MKDLVIGCITGYDFDKIKPWVNSLCRSGFEGTKAMICYNVGYETVEELVKRDFTIFAFGKNDNEKRLEYKENLDRKSTRLNSSHSQQSRMPSSA